MKRLKIQKALLTICLALATTFQISNGINATQNHTPYSKSDPQKEETNKISNGPKVTTAQQVIQGHAQTK